MKTEIIKVNPKKPDNKIIKDVAKKIMKGKIIVYPTETCYGLGANALNEEAVEKIYEIKKEPKRSNIIVIIHNLKTARKFGVISKKVERLVKKFMSEPLTLIVKRKKQFPKITNKDFAFRISGNKFALRLARKAKVPITATSANIHGKPSIYSGEEVIEQFKGKVDAILDAGKLKKIKPSTIVDMKTKEPIIVRQGPISFSKIKSTVKRF